MKALNIVMLSVHSSPLGELGKRNNGGMSTYILELAEKLEKRGHRIDIFTLRRNRGQKPVVSLGQRTRLFHLDIGKSGNISKTSLFGRLPDFFAALEASRRRENGSYDLVHSHYWLSGQVGERVQSRWGLPHVMTFHSLGMVKREVLHVAREPDVRIRVERKLARSSDRILVPTRREYENMVAYYETPASRMVVIPCGVNLKRFRPYPKSEARRKLALPAAGPLVLYVGRFTSEKGLDRLLSALPLVHSRFEPKLILVGGDDAQAASTKRLKSRVRQLGLEDRILFAGRVPNAALPLYYSASSLMVLPSLYESFGLVALESLACGTPVVSTPVGALEHVILRGKTGEVVSDSGPGALARGIDKVLTRTKETGYVQSKVRASVTCFDWSNIAAAVEREYDNLTRGRERSRKQAAVTHPPLPVN